MTLKDYNGFTGEEREKFAKFQEKAIEDYTNTKRIINTNHPVCWICHQYIHNQKDRNPEIYNRYVEEVKDTPRDPVYITNLWSTEDD